MSLSQGSLLLKTHKSLNIIENDTPAPANEPENQAFLRIPTKSFADSPNKVY